MAEQILKALDPRLRRILARSEALSPLVAGASAGFALDYADFIATSTAGSTSFGRLRYGREREEQHGVLVTLPSDEIPAEFEHLGWTRVCAGIYTLSAPIEVLARVAAALQVRYVEASRPMYPLLDTSICEVKVDRLHAGTSTLPPLRGQGVLIGIVDFGLDFTLDDFRDSEGNSRIEFLWDQTLTSNPTEHPPPGRTFGVEYTKAEIDEALATNDPFARIRHVPKSIHGTHVAGIAAGNGRSSDSEFPAGKYIGIAPESGIIFVQPKVSFGTSFTASRDMADTLEYIFERARNLKRPCVINLSLGNNSGSHDGESTLERAIDTLLQDPGTAVVVAAGNEQEYAVHASGFMREGELHTLEWRLPRIPASADQNRIPCELEIWYSSRDIFEVCLTDPNGFSTPWQANGDNEVTSPSGDAIFVSVERFTPQNGDARILLTIGGDWPTRINSGIWKVELRGLTVRNGRYDAWIERSRREEARNFADQSVFVGERVDPTMTLGVPATSRRGITVANYDHVHQRISPSSSRGGTRDGRNKPDVAAPGVEITSACALGGTIAGREKRPIRIRLSGTSMSAPHVTGIVALLFQKKADLSADQIREVLVASATPPAADVAFDPAWGYGRVDAVAALELLP